MTITHKINIATCWWFNKNAKQAANFPPETRETKAGEAPYET